MATQDDTVPMFSGPVIQYQARHSPIHYPHDLKAEAAYRTALVQSIKSLEETRKDWAKMTVDSWTDAHDAMAGALAKMAAAIATGQGIATQGKFQFLADINRKRQELAAERSYNAADPKVLEAFTGKVIPDMQAELSVMDSKGGSQSLVGQALATNAAHPDVALNRAADVFIENGGGKMLINRIVESVSGIQDKASLGDTANTLTWKGLQAFGNGVINSEIMGADGKTPLSIDEKRKIAAIAMSKMQVAVQSKIPDMSAAQAAEHAKAERDIAELNAMADKYGVGTPFAAEVKAIIADTLGPMKGGVEGYAACLNTMPIAPDLGLALSTMYSELHKIGQDPPDPLEMAIHNMVSSIPNFGTWMAAMRFRSVENACKYAARHPNELKTFIAWQDTHPDLGTDAVKLRKQIISQGKAEGWGYFSSPLGRALQVSLRKRDPHAILQDAQAEQLELAGEDLADAKFDAQADFKQHAAETAEALGEAPPGSAPKPPVGPATAGKVPTPEEVAAGAPTGSVKGGTHKPDAGKKFQDEANGIDSAPLLDATAAPTEAPTPPQAAPGAPAAPKGKPKPKAAPAVATPPTAAPAAPVLDSTPAELPETTPNGYEISQVAQAADGNYYGMDDVGTIYQLNGDQWEPAEIEETAAPEPETPAAPEPAPAEPDFTEGEVNTEPDSTEGAAEVSKAAPAEAAPVATSPAELDYSPVPEAEEPAAEEPAAEPEPEAAPKPEGNVTRFPEISFGQPAEDQSTEDQSTEPEAKAGEAPPSNEAEAQATPPAPPPGGNKSAMALAGATTGRRPTTLPLQGLFGGANPRPQMGDMLEPLYKRA